MNLFDRRRFLAAALALAARPGAAQPSITDAIALLASMVQAYAKVSDYTMELHKEEWLAPANGEAGGRLAKEVGQVRFRKRPISNGGADGTAYARDIRFDKGCTLLCPAVFREGLNGDRISIRGVINVDPHGARAMEGQHHPITNLDLGPMLALIHDQAVRAHRAGVLSASIDGRSRFDDRDVHELTARIQGAVRSLRVGEGETLRAFAERAGTQAHLLVHHNNDRLASVNDAVAAGAELKVPEYYAQRVRLWIDTERLLPLQIEVYDTQDRLYERYAYRKLATNVGSSDEHFR